QTLIVSPVVRDDHSMRRSRTLQVQGVGYPPIGQAQPEYRDGVDPEGAKASGYCRGDVLVQVEVEDLLALVAANPLLDFVWVRLVIVERGLEHRLREVAVALAQDIPVLTGD